MEVTYGHNSIIKFCSRIDYYRSWYTKKGKKKGKKKENSGGLEDEKDHWSFEYLINKLNLLPQHEQMLALVESLS